MQPFIDRTNVKITHLEEKIAALREELKCVVGRTLTAKTHRWLSQMTDAMVMVGENDPETLEFLREIEGTHDIVKVRGFIQMNSSGTEYYQVSTTASDEGVGSELDEAGFTVIQSDKDIDQIISFGNYCELTNPYQVSRYNDQGYDNLTIHQTTIFIISKR
jgi:hypothetical protein